MAYNLPNVKPWVLKAANLIGPKFGITTIGGWRKSDPYPDHPSGLALDFMIPGQNVNNGNNLAQYVINNAKALGVKYLIWNDRVWNPAQGWHAYQPSNPNRNRHRDHVHVTFTAAEPPSGAILNDSTAGEMPVITHYTDDDGLVGAVSGAARALSGMAEGVQAIGALAKKLMWLALPTTQVRIISGILGIFFLFMGVRLLVKEGK